MQTRKTHRKVYLFIGKKLFFKYSSCGSEESTCSRRRYVFKKEDKKKASASVLSCPVLISHLCVDGSIYSAERREGLLIEENDTSVSQFTVHMPPVIHLVLSLLYKPANYKPVRVE